MADPSIQYLAGLFDGEGHVGVHMDAKGSLSCFLHIINTDFRVAQMFADRWGGEPKQRRFETGLREVAEWRIAGPKADEAAKELVEWCVVKKAQLEAFIDLKSVLANRGRPYTAEEKAVRQEKLIAFEGVAERRWANRRPLVAVGG